ncbi:MAG: hypothetical protein A4E65_02151 [Syntrophorhabdus sp. PtaU1.Bin153]|nr:MAG: hypothetical protein A4E65_02151 [Syntrophorhabdus sp. PtaU1.Bin153]
MDGGRSVVPEPAKVTFGDRLYDLQFDCTAHLPSAGVDQGAGAEVDRA